MDNVQSFLQQFHIMNKAAVGVAFVRAREPFRAMSALRDYAVGQKIPFRAWTPMRGWSDRNADPIESLKGDAAIEVIPALRSVGTTEGIGKEDALFVMFYPHPAIAQNGKASANMTAVQCLKEYAINFPASQRRLVLIVPPEFQLPPELADDMVTLDFQTPGSNEMLSIYETVLRATPENKRPSYTPDEVRRLLAVGAGMTANEFRIALTRGLATHRMKLPNVPLEDIVEVLSCVKTETLKRSEVLELVKSDSMDNVGGLDELKDYIAEHALCFSEEARAFGVDLPKGIGLIGPPGTGKSLIAKSVASALGIPMVRFDVGRVFNSLVGSSEARLREALALVEAISPAVLFIDEVDKAFDQNSSGGDSGVGKRVLGTLLTWMNDCTKPVYIVVTANDVRGLPPEFLRKGRLDEIFSVTVPNEAERLDILNIHLKKRGKDPAQIKDLDIVVHRSNGYVPAELEAAVKEAIVKAFVHKKSLTGALIAAQLDGMKPLSEAFAEKFEAMRAWAENNARPASRSIRLEEKSGEVITLSKGPRLAFD